MKRIEMLADVRDAPGYLKGEVRMVSPETAGYFVGLGWARYAGEVASAPNTDPVSLTVQNGKHGQTATDAGAH